MADWQSWLTTLELTPLEVQLVHFLSQQGDRVVSRSELIERVWRNKPTATERVVDVAMSKLRRKLNPQKIRLVTIYGSGYMCVSPETMTGRSLPIKDI